MHRNAKVKLLGLMVGVVLLSVISAWAQTPLDTTVLAVRTSMATTWAPLFITLGGIAIALGALYMLHAGPTVVVGLVIGFLVLALIAAAANGTLGAFLGVIG